MARDAQAWRAVVLWTVLVMGCDAGDDDSRRGKPCATDTECEALVCTLDADAEPEDLAPAALACAELGAGEGPGAACESAADCDHGLCLLAGGCAVPCGSEADCDERERCQEVFARTADAALQPLTACVRRVELPDDAEVDVETRGDPLSVGENLISVEPRAGTAGRSFVVLEHSDPTWPGTRCAPPLCLSSLRADDGQMLFDATADYGEEPPPLVGVATSGHIDPIVLRLPKAGEPGASRRYFAALEAEREGELTVTTISREGTGQALDLHVFYVGELPIAPSGERGAPALADALDEVDAILGQAGIFIGRVQQVAVRGELPMRGTYFPMGDESMGFTVLQIRYGTHVELPGLFRLSAGAPFGGVSLFLLDKIDPRVQGGEPYAEAGGVPGPPGMLGSAGSGIAFAARMMLGDPTAFGRTLAHEIAHYLGLFHTSEQDGRVLDNLDDTPECRADLDAASDGLDRDDCQANGADNLMVWATATGTLLTEQQRALLAESPLLR